MSSRSTHGAMLESSCGLRRWQAGLLAAVLLLCGGRGASGQVPGDSVGVAARGWAVGPDGDRLWVAPGDVYAVDVVRGDTAYVTVGGVRFGIASSLHGRWHRPASERTSSGLRVAGVGGYAWGTAPTPIVREGAEWGGDDRLVIAGALGGVRARIEYTLRDRRLVAGRYVLGVGPGETPVEVHARVAADLERSLGPPTCGPPTDSPCAGSPRGGLVRPETSWQGDGGTVSHRLGVVDGEVVHEVVYLEGPR